MLPSKAVRRRVSRVFDAAQRAFLIERIRQIVPAVAATYRATGEL